MGAAGAAQGPQGAAEGAEGDEPEGEGWPGEGGGWHEGGGWPPPSLFITVAHTRPVACAGAMPGVVFATTRTMEPTSKRCPGEGGECRGRRSRQGAGGGRGCQGGEGGGGGGGGGAAGDLPGQKSRVVLWAFG